MCDRPYQTQRLRWLRGLLRRVLGRLALERPGTTRDPLEAASHRGQGVLGVQAHMRG